MALGTGPHTASLLKLLVPTVDQRETGPQLERHDIKKDKGFIGISTFMLLLVIVVTVQAYSHWVKHKHPL